jgi:hypothetical protein
MSELDDLIEKWVHKDHPAKMPGLEVCVYEASLIDGLEWAAEEGATNIAALRADLALLRQVATDARWSIGQARDLARTGLAPDEFNMVADQWMQHKLNRVSAILTAWLDKYADDSPAGDAPDEADRVSR